MPKAWAKAGIVFLLVASLALKAWSGNVTVGAYEQTNGSTLADMFSDKGFLLIPGAGLEGESWIASKGDCRVELVVVSPLGWHQSAVAARGPKQSAVYIYKHRIHPTQPVLETKLDIIGTN